MNENEISSQVIGAAIEVHKELGPGLLESVYETALCHELKGRNMSFERQKVLPVTYKGETIDHGGFRADLVVESLVIVEIKAVETVMPVHEVQLLTYLKLTRLKLGLLLNFHSAVMKNGIKRIVNGL